MNKSSIAVIVLSTLFLAACGGPSNRQGLVPSGEKKVVSVQTEILKQQSFTSYLEVTGTVKARNHIDIIVEEGGVLRKILLDKGQMATAGSTLAVLENKVLLATFQQAEAALKQAELDHDSKKVLFDKKAISQNEYLNSKYAFDSAKAGYALAEARYEKLTITAPIGGLVNQRYYDLGAYTNPMTAIFELIDSERLRIVAGVAERFMGTVEVGTPVVVSFDAYPNTVVEAEVSFISRSIDPMNRTFDIEIEMPNPQRRLAPEMVADVKIRQQVFEKQIVVPVDALIETEQGWHVYVEEQGQARKVSVRKLAIYEDVVLVEGLLAGQKLITVGHQNLSEGDPVAVTEI